MHEDAIYVLRRVVEPDVLSWLDALLKEGRYGDLATVIRPGASDDDIHRDMLRAAITWTRGKREQVGKLTGGGKAGEDETPDEDWKRAPK